MKPSSIGFGILSCLAVAVACAGSTGPISSERLAELRLGMTQDQVQSVLGAPSVVRGAVRNKFDQTIYVWEYRLALPSTDTRSETISKSMSAVLTLGLTANSFAGEERDYWLYFLDEELVQWGQASDWAAEADRIHELRFQPRARPAEDDGS